jgi:hypothetical protein
VSRYTIKEVMSTSAPYGVWDIMDSSYMCQCETEADARVIINALTTQDEMDEGYYD